MKRLIICMFLLSCTQKEQIEPAKGAILPSKCGTVGHTFSLKWGEVTLPAKGLFVEESHYATTEDKFNKKLFPSSVEEGIVEHLERSCAVLKVPCSELYKGGPWKREWTPAEHGLAGQGARGDIKPEVWAEMFQGNMMFKKLPEPGTKILLKNKDHFVVVNMGQEIGPGSKKFLGGITTEAHYFLGSGNETELEVFYLKDQTTKEGLIDCN